MNEQNEILSQMRAVTLSREYGSGGGEIAARLAQRLGWILIDHDVVVRVAQQLGVTEAEAEAHDERTDSTLARILSSMQLVGQGFYTAPIVPEQSNTAAYREALQSVMQAAVRKGHVVIVGRGSQIYLAQQRSVLHVRIIAPLALRISYVMQREGLDEAQARSRIQLKERDRERYLQAEYHQQPADPHLYDLILNTEVISLDGAVDMITLALQSKAQQLIKTTGELGPVAGLARYPSEPTDFRPPESQNV